MTDIELYIKRYCEEYKIDEETAKQHVIVKEVAKYYEDAKKGKISPEGGAYKWLDIGYGLKKIDNGLYTESLRP